ncbi:MAG: hypothetical protein N3B21_11420 [Clostridia bacterium]|nr:hypothetical protein [Clostridia bacterium]
MEMFKIGDVVARKSYGCDILFKIADIIKSERESLVILRGISYRLLADAPESDLLLQPVPSITECTSEKKLRV